MVATPIEEKIALLLKKAESTDSPQEAEALTEAAEKLMIKHGIERAMLDMEHDKKEEIVVIKHLFTGIYGFEKMVGAVEVATSLGLRGYYIDSRKSYRKENRGVILCIVGFKSDAEDALQLVLSLDLQCAVALKAWGKTELPTWYSGMEKYKARRSFIEYFGRGAAKRIKSNRKQVIEEAATGTDLVLVSRSEQVDNFYADLGLRSSANRRDSSFTGMGAGFAAGQNANTGERAIGDRKRINA